jgi:hypothetical protein
VEVLATYAALERVSCANHSLADLQRKLPELLEIAENSPWTKRLCSTLSDGIGARGGNGALRIWLKDFYSWRGSAAHGKTAMTGPGPWVRDEHLLAGAFLFPLALKCQLSAKGLYGLTVLDVAKILGLELLLSGRPFFPLQRPNKAESPMEVGGPDGWRRRLGRIHGAVFDLAQSTTLEAAYDKATSASNSG